MHTCKIVLCDSTLRVRTDSKMPIKKQKTVKELNADVENLYNEIELLKSVIKQLKDSIVLKDNKKTVQNVKTKCKDITTNQKCFKCNETFKTMKELKNHITNHHPKKIKCEKCNNIFESKSVLENHILDEHGESETYPCSECGQQFFSEWRKKKHIESHKSTNKFCHFYNNAKFCQYEKLGCKFKHERAPVCKFGTLCERHMCQYAHNFHNSKTKDQNMDYDPNLAANSCVDKDKNAIDTSSEKVEARILFCDKYCDDEYDLHIHENRTFLMWRGIDIFKYADIFKCKICGNVSGAMEDHMEHYEEKHNNADVYISCMIGKCEFKANRPESLIIHIRSVHQKL